jgi:hypothetical protein
MIVLLTMLLTYGFDDNHTAVLSYYVLVFRHYMYKYMQPFRVPCACSKTHSRAHNHKAFGKSVLDRNVRCGYLDGFDISSLYRLIIA